MQANRTDDAATQSALLGFVLNQHPVLLSAEEIAREIGAGDTTDRAMRDQTGAGLLRREGASVLPTRAALHFDSLQAS
jgi:hypothetical protein